MDGLMTECLPVTRRLERGDVLWIGDTAVSLASDGPQRVYLEIESVERVRVEQRGRRPVPPEFG